jgi:hypothetical protein
MHALKPLAVLLLLVVPTPRLAADLVLDFQDMAIGNDVQPYLKDDFSLAATPRGSSAVFVRPSNSSFGTTTSGRWVIPSFGFDDHGFLLTRVSGDPFNLVSFEVLETLSETNGPNPTTLIVTGTRSQGGTITQHVTKDGIAGPQLITLSNFTDLIAVEFQSMGSTISDVNTALDNIRVQAIPEPSAGLLLTALTVTIAAGKRMLRRPRRVERS